MKPLLAVASRLTSYPDDHFHEELADVTEWLNEEAPENIKEDWLKVVNLLKTVPLQELREHYVDTFDWKEKNGLYLTAQELGDSRKRGAALIKLQRTINEAGFERTDGELADYIPMIYEFLAVAEESSQITQLENRIAVATYQISQNIDPDSPFASIFKLLMEHVFQSPSVEEIQTFKQEHEKADTDALPYPLMYE